MGADLTYARDLRRLALNPTLSALFKGARLVVLPSPPPFVITHGLSESVHSPERAVNNLMRRVPREVELQKLASTCNHFKVAWARKTNHNWWPARIISTEEYDSEDAYHASDGERANGDVLVLFLQTTNWDGCQRSKMCLRGRTD